MTSQLELTRPHARRPQARRLRPARDEPPLRVVVADTDVLLRTGLASLLDQREECTVAGTTDDPDQLLEIVRVQRPDVVVLGAGSSPAPEASGPAHPAAVRLRELYPGLGIVLLATHVDVEAASDLLTRSRGVGVLLRQRITDVDAFVDALRQVSRGGCALDPDVVPALVTARRRDQPLSRLSKRERDVLALMAQGRSNLGIARELWLAEGTVEKHVRSILTKLDLDSGPLDHRRVLAVVTFLRSDRAPAGIPAGLPQEMVPA